MKAALNTECTGACSVVDRLVNFARFRPRFPDHDDAKRFAPTPPLPLATTMTRTDVMQSLTSLRASNTVADLAFYAARDFSCTDWRPFIKAAVERNPVCIAGSRNWSTEHLLETVQSWSNDSIYDGARMAQPDEVWNYRRGDGLEKAIMLADIFINRFPDKTVEITVQPDHVVIRHDQDELRLPSIKGLSGRILLANPHS